MSKFKNLANLINDANKEKNVGDQFLDDLKKTIQMNSKPRKPSQSFKPSSVGGCERNVFYQITGAELDPHGYDSVELIGMGETGTDRHDRIQEHVQAMKDQGFNCEWIDVEEYIEKRPHLGTEVKQKMGNEWKLYNKEYNFSFLCDGIIRYKGEFYVLEIKTEISHKFNKRSDVDESHYAQACSYSAFLGINKVFFIYENRDVLAKKVYLFEVTENMRKRYVFDVVERVNDFVKNQQIPPMTENTRLCQYCKYKERCEADGVTEN